MKYLLILPLVLGGCATQQKHIHVITSTSEVTVKSFDLEDGDKVVCDPEGCRVLR